MFQLGLGSSCNAASEDSAKCFQWSMMLVVVDKSMTLLMQELCGPVWDWVPVRHASSQAGYWMNTGPCSCGCMAKAGSLGMGMPGDSAGAASEHPREGHNVALIGSAFSS